MSDTEKIRELNDAMRKGLSKAFEGNHQPNPHCVYFMTRGFQEIDLDSQFEIIVALMNFTDFNEDNDPWGMHDFGSIKLGGYHVFWKIDYYDVSMEKGSEDPADESQTKRVLTLMLSEEY